MTEAELLKKQLMDKGFPVHEGDIPYILMVLNSIKRAPSPFGRKTDLNEEVPVVIVDKELLKYD
ncbi:hypothetical protein GJU40_17615 [Bacillus lacus]|uniref:Uncharacterized protein n=1 Tax=Metabacillus lacus TaxID=1983721 RepID=A0A7X2J1X2_9BACI|nr:hypothetical protein [Metabacillus lacus]MRX73952.1 hypothetical protein [Metabacillus lacus]